MHTIAHVRCEWTDRVRIADGCMWRMVGMANIWWFIAHFCDIQKARFAANISIYLSKIVFPVNSSDDLVSFRFFNSQILRIVTNRVPSFRYECLRCVKVSLSIRRYIFGKFVSTWNGRIRIRTPNPIGAGIVDASTLFHAANRSVATPLRWLPSLWINTRSHQCLSSFPTFIVGERARLQWLGGLAAVLCLMKRTPNVPWIKY